MAGPSGLVPPGLQSVLQCRGLKTHQKQFAIAVIVIKVCSILLY